MFQRPPVYLGHQPTPPRREGSSGGRPGSRLLPRRRQRLPRPTRPSPPRRPRPRPRKGPGGASQEPRLRSRAARPPPVPRPGALSRACRSRARGKAGPGPRVPRRRGGRGPESLGRRGRPEPRGSRAGSASLPGPPGRLGPSAACASSEWRFDGAGPGPPAPGRPKAAGAQARSRGRQGAGCGAGRPAGGRAACCGCAGAEIAGDCAVGHSPQSGCATVGLRRGDCDRAGSSQPPATSGNGERCRLCRRRGGGEGGEHARDARARLPRPAAAMMGRSALPWRARPEGPRGVGSPQLPAGSPRSPFASQVWMGWRPRKQMD